MVMVVVRVNASVKAWDRHTEIYISSVSEDRCNTLTCCSSNNLWSHVL